MRAETTVVVVDDHPLYRRGVVETVSAAPGITVVGETATISGTGGDFNGALQAAAGAAATWNGPVCGLPPLPC